MLSLPNTYVCTIYEDLRAFDNYLKYIDVIWRFKYEFYDMDRI